jgi:hypothetical protein
MTTMHDHLTNDRRWRDRVRRLGVASCLGGAGLLAGSFLAYGPAGALLTGSPPVQVVSAATPGGTPTPTSKTKLTKKKSTTTTTTSTATVTATPVPVATSVPVATPAPVPTTAPAPAGGVLGTSTTSTSSPDSGSAVIGPPATGADVPFAAGSLLMMAGGGLLAATRRRRS